MCSVQDDGPKNKSEGTTSLTFGVESFESVYVEWHSAGFICETIRACRVYDRTRGHTLTIMPLSCPRNLATSQLVIRRDMLVRASLCLFLLLGVKYFGTVKT